MLKNIFAAIGVYVLVKTVVNIAEDHLEVKIIRKEKVIIPTGTP